MERIVTISEKFKTNSDRDNYFLKRRDLKHCLSDVYRKEFFKLLHVRRILLNRYCNSAFLRGQQTAKYSCDSNSIQVWHLARIIRYG